MLLIAMAVIVVLGVLAFLVLRSGGIGKGTLNSPANTHSLMTPPRSLLASRLS